MRKNWYIFAVIVVTLVMASCKTTEENYRSAYEIAAERKMGTSTGDRTLNGFIERERRLSETKVVAGDSVRIVTEHVSMVDGKASDVHKCCVVVGDFQQVFNARSFCKRINEAEGNTDAYVVMNAQKVYYVVYKGFATREDAASFLRNKENFKILVPKKEPWIVELP